MGLDHEESSPPKNVLKKRPVIPDREEVVRRTDWGKERAGTELYHNLHDRQRSALGSRGNRTGGTVVMIMSIGSGRDGRCGT